MTVYSLLLRLMASVLLLSAASVSATVTSAVTTSAATTSANVVNTTSNTRVDAAGVLRLDQAQVLYYPSTAPGTAVTAGAGANTLRQVRLPDSWGKHLPPMQGRAVYSWRFDAAPPWLDGAALSLYMPRAGNRFAVHLNGQLLGKTGDLDQIDEDHVNTPHLFGLPPGALRVSGNQLDIELRGELARYAGLSEVLLGPTAVLQPVYKSRTNWQNGGALFIVGLASLMGVLALSFGLIMGDKTQLLFGAAALIWALRNTYTLVIQAPLPHPWWGITVDVFYGLAVTLFATSVLRVLRENPRLWRWVVVVLLACTFTLPLLHGLNGWLVMRRIWLLVLVSGVAIAAFFVLRHWWRVRSFNANVLAVAAILAVAVSVYDHVAILYLPSGYGNFALVRFVFLIVLMAMSILLMRRVMRALNTARRFRTRLQNRLQRALGELSQVHQAQERAQVERAQLNERLRVLQEMHDGVGGHLIALKNMLGSQRASQEDLEHELQQANLALRDSMQALHNAPGDWLSTLVTLRDTLESRLKYAGITLHWRVEAAPELPPASTEQLRRLRFFVIEAVNNIIKHSGAKNATLYAQLAATGDPAWVLRLCDDGRGLPPAHDQHGEHGEYGGNGLKNMGLHAQALGGQLQLQTPDPNSQQAQGQTPGPGLCVELRLPIAHNPTPAPSLP